MKYKRIILVGPGASGKDYFKDYLVESGYTFPISYTTRPPRPNEINGHDYHFVDVFEFKSMIDNHQMYEFVLYEDVGLNKDENWYYGRTKEDFYSGQVVIMTPAGIDQLKEEDLKESFTIYFDIDESIRRKRLNKRDDSDDTERRLRTDREDFKNFTSYNYKVTDHEFVCSNIHMMLEKALGFFPNRGNKMA